MENYSVLDDITISETDILEVCRLKNQFWPHALESQLKWWHNNTSTTDKFIIIRSNQTIVAFLRLRQGYIDSLDYARKPSICITEVCVHQQYQQRGLGRRLLDFAITYISSIGYNYAYLLCSESQEPFYTKSGFHTVTNPLSIVSMRNSHVRQLSPSERCMTWPPIDPSTSVLKIYGDTF